MLLRRLSEHVREQNWFAVGLDFVVVVVGIFVGLQVDGWNEERVNRAREAAHLQQLLAETEANIDQVQWGVEHHAEMESDIRFVIGAMKRGELSEEDYDRFKWTILTIEQFPPLAMNMATYNSLIASGDFALISDPDIKSALVDTESHRISDQEMLQIYREGTAFPEDLEDRSVRAIPHPSGRGLEWQVDFEIMRDDPRTLGGLGSALYGHGNFYRFRSEYLAHLLATRELLAQAVEGTGSGN